MDNTAVDNYTFYYGNSHHDKLIKINYPREQPWRSWNNYNPMILYYAISTLLINGNLSFMRIIHPIGTLLKSFFYLLYSIFSLRLLIQKHQIRLFHKQKEKESKLRGEAQIRGIHPLPPTPIIKRNQKLIFIWGIHCATY